MWSDEFGGNSRLRARHERWGEAWVQRGVPFSEWLLRPGAGKFPFPSSSPREWAATQCSDEDLELAGQVVQGRFEVLGLGSVELGDPPAWRRDPRSGITWPLLSAHRVHLDQGNGSDVRSLWELNRCHHFALLGKAYWRTGQSNYLDAFRSHVDSWDSDNPLGKGPNWHSAMDAALRAANWILAGRIFAEAEELPGSFWAGFLANLRVTADYIMRRLEWHPVWRGNHYIADGAGLVHIGSLFADSPEGRRWLKAGASILASEMDYQVEPDGVCFEASLGYHRLVTELLARGGELCQENLPGFLSPSYFSRLESMYTFVDAYMAESAEAPLLGDGDDGRLFKVSAEDYRSPGNHRSGLPARYRPVPSADSVAFRSGGFYVLRVPRLHCIVRCGAVGLRGGGSHDHNDALSLELVVDGRRVLQDSGTYIYYGDLRERFRFRSTASHNVLQIGEEELNPITPDRPWRVLQDRTQARCTEWVSTPQRVRFVGLHAGYAHRPSGAICSRAITVERNPAAWWIEDRVEGVGGEEVAWRMHFAPGTLSVTPEHPGTWIVHHEGEIATRFRLISSTALSAAVQSSWVSPRYGFKTPRSFLVLTGHVALPFSVRFELL